MHFIRAIRQPQYPSIGKQGCQREIVVADTAPAARDPVRTAARSRQRNVCSTTGPGT